MQVPGSAAHSTARMTTLAQKKIPFYLVKMFLGRVGDLGALALIWVEICDFNDLGLMLAVILVTSIICGPSGFRFL